MIKDPEQKLDTPYDLLGLPPAAGRAAVQGALPRFMRDRRNIPRLGQAQEAVRKLQNAKARAAVDIWFYEVDLAAVDGEAVAGPPDLEEFRQIPVMPAERLYCDLDGGIPAADFRQISAAQVKFSDVKLFDGLEGVKPRPRFDR